MEHCAYGWRKCPCSHAALHNRQNIGTLATNTLGSAGQCAREPGSSMIRPIANALLRDVRQRAEAKHLRAVASRCDAFLTSYPKCGRTWLRYLLSHYLAETVGLGFQPDLVSTFRILPNFDCDPVRGVPAFHFQFGNASCREGVCPY